MAANVGFGQGTVDIYAARIGNGHDFRVGRGHGADFGVAVGDDAGPRGPQGHVVELLGQAVDGIAGFGLGGIFTGHTGRDVADILRLQVVQGRFGDDQGLIGCIQFLLGNGAFVFQDGIAVVIHLGRVVFDFCFLQV